MLERSIALVSVALFALGCPASPDDTAALGERGDCNPVGGGEHCLLPFPSSFFLTEDTATPSGYRVDFGPTSLPLNDFDVRTDPTYWNEKDGFPTLGAMYAHFPDLSVDGVVSHEDLDAYLADDAKTVILNAETGERVPHFGELEVRVRDDDESLFILRPVVPMEHATRYVVGIRGLVDSGGATLEALPGFVELRDGGESADPDVERQRAHYDQDVFPVLEQAGFPRSELQLAWDLRTVSSEGNLGKLLMMRDDALERVADGPAVSFELIGEEDCSAKDPPNIGRTLKGTMGVPLYLDSWDPGSNLTRGADGMPFYNGDQDVEFTVRIPCSLINEPRAGRLVQYGHGLLGGQSEVYTGWLSEVANRYGWVLFATDWTGMKSDDVMIIMDEIGDGMSNFATVPDRLHQGIIEFHVSAEAMVGPGASDPLLQQDGVLLYDPEQLYYYGNSQGSILGGAYVATSKRIERGVFGVGGMPYSLLLTRSYDFELYFMLLRGQYGSDMDISLLIGLMQMLWDPTEGSGWARFMNQEAIDELTPPKQVLVQVGIGDAQVPTLGGQIQARAWGASLVDPPVREVWGVETAQAPFVGDAYVEFDFGVEEPVLAEPCPEETDTHESVRRELNGQEQVELFFEDGTIEHFCDGACDPD
jgi:hypothetical protein